MVVPSPSGAKPLNRLKPSAHGSDSAMTNTMFTSTDFFLVQFQRSIPNDTIFSNTAIIVDKAANVMNMKNRIPHTRPPGMALKIFGRVTNTKPGPLPGFTPKEKQAGKIIRPEISATSVSSVVILTVSPIKLLSLCR